jgi:DNA polymerase epsilon subunit 1
MAKKIEDIINYDGVKKEIVGKLMELRERPKRLQSPFVYHLHVGAMYPNIFLRNRLQPNAIVDDETCAACDYNQAANNCKRLKIQGGGSIKIEYPGTMLNSEVNA